MSNKYRNKANYPSELLVEMQYRFRDKITRTLVGAVTGRGYGRWKYGEKGLVHVADAIIFVQRGVLYPLDSEEYSEKVQMLNSGGVKNIKKSIPRSLDVTKLKFVGDVTGTRLIELGYHDVEKVANANAEVLVEQLQLIHINKARAQAIIDDAKEVLKSNGLL